MKHRQQEKVQQIGEQQQQQLLICHNNESLFYAISHTYYHASQSWKGQR